jgi:hypothetical protein
MYCNLTFGKNQKTKTSTAFHGDKVPTKKEERRKKKKKISAEKTNDISCIDLKKNLY